MPIGSPAAPVDQVRVPPHNFEAEQSLLGAILLSNPAYEKVSEFLKPEHFADPVHGRIFAICGKLIERGQMANPVTLKAFFEQDGGLAEIGGTAYLAQLANSVVSVVNSGDYGRLVYDLHQRRELIGFGVDVVNDAYEVSIDTTAAQQISEAEGKLFQLATSGRSEGEPKTFNEFAVSALKQAEHAHYRRGKLSGVPTGLTDLDKKLGGLHPSDLLIIAGRPGMGKTSIATNIAFNAARAYREEVENGTTRTADGAVCVFFSLEMSGEQLVTRILSEQAEVASYKIRQGELNEEEFMRLVVASTELHRLNLFVDDTPALTVSAVRTRSRRLKRKNPGLGLIIIDYLPLLQGSSATKENRVQEVSEITRGLKALAKELNLPVIALSQLSRAVEQREDKQPQLSDLRESGSIEQDADVVMFVYREEYYLNNSEPSRRPEETLEKFNDRHATWHERMNEARNIAEVIIAKQRHGPTGTVRLHFSHETTKFSDLAEP